MSRQPNVIATRKDFIRVLDSNLNLFETILPYAKFSYHNNKASFHPAQATRVVGLCFMSSVGAWEEFLGDTFIRYLAGARTPSYIPKLKIGKCLGISHAIEVLGGKSGYDLSRNYLTWTNYGDVISKAKIYFDRGEPFSKVPHVYKDRIADAIVIRNRVAHTSEKCVKDFAKVAKPLLGLSLTAKLPHGMSVGKLLLTTKVNHFQVFNSDPTYYKAYDSMLRHLAYMIVPD
jgi:hypothetical protein